MFFSRKHSRSQKGQSLTELALIIPLLLLLALGAIEFANMISGYKVLTHLTREGANLIARETEPFEALNVVINSSGLLVSGGGGNPEKWRVIHVTIGPDPNLPPPVSPNPDTRPYVILRQIVVGALALGAAENEKRICPMCDVDTPIFECGSGSCPSPPNVPNIDSLVKGQTFQAVEAFYDYDPLTPLQNFIGLFNDKFYERGIFTNIGPAAPVAGCPPSLCPPPPPPPPPPP
ncbi:MAG: TadE/TadG family type IV pilus assembly protein, partial [Nitrososphaera sp.]